MDTCCIDKSSSAELSEAVNSMFQWYRKATVCYAYLQDVPDHQDAHALSRSFQKSEWFERGWTLQELIAPSTLYFFGSSWKRIGSRHSLTNLVAQVTGIDLDVFTTGDLSKYCVAQKMSWASKRKCTRIEDEAYSLLGIFGINMPLLYGEGSKAFQRLQEEILTRTGDYSLLAHGSEEPTSQLRLFTPHTLAASSSSFRGSRSLQRNTDMALPPSSLAPNNTVSITPAGIRLPIQLVGWSAFSHQIKQEVMFSGGKQSKVALALLGCETPGGDTIAAILIRETSDGFYEKQRLKVYGEDGFCMVDRSLVDKATWKSIVLKHSVVHVPDGWTFDERHHHFSLAFPPSEILGYDLVKSSSPTGQISRTVPTGDKLRVEARMGQIGYPLVFVFADSHESRFALTVCRSSKAPFIDMNLSRDVKRVETESFNIWSAFQGSTTRLDGSEAAKEYTSMVVPWADKDAVVEVSALRRRDGWHIDLGVSNQSIPPTLPTSTTATSALPIPATANNPRTTPANLHTWLGHIATEHYSAKYVQLRHELSDAAYFGNWQALFKCIREGEELFQESWVNAPRMSMCRSTRGSTITNQSFVSRSHLSN